MQCIMKHSTTIYIVQEGRYLRMLQGQQEKHTKTSSAKAKIAVMYEFCNVKLTNTRDLSEDIEGKEEKTLSPHEPLFLNQNFHIINAYPKNKDCCDC
jgi:hypothetical protein